MKNNGKKKELSQKFIFGQPCIKFAISMAMSILDHSHTREISKFLQRINEKLLKVSNC